MIRTYWIILAVQSTKEGSSHSKGREKLVKNRKRMRNNKKALKNINQAKKSIQEKSCSIIRRKNIESHSY